MMKRRWPWWKKWVAGLSGALLLAVACIAALVVSEWTYLQRLRHFSKKLPTSIEWFEPKETVGDVSAPARLPKADPGKVSLHPEAVSNAVRHSNAGQVLVTFTADDRSVDLMVEDDVLTFLGPVVFAIPGLSEPALVRFAPDSYWRGEAHRLVDRPASLGRLLEELAGVELSLDEDNVAYMPDQRVELDCKDQTCLVIRQSGFTARNLYFRRGRPAVIVGNKNAKWQHDNLMT